MAAYKFRVLLDSEEENDVFRDIVIDSKANFEVFFKAIVSSFNFEGNQMASFYLSNDEWDKGSEISLLDTNYGDELDSEKVAVMAATPLEELIEQKEDKLILVYDFMSMWIFLIELIEITEDEVEKAKTTLSVGIAPPEDSKMSHFGDDEEDLFYEDEEEEDEFGFNEFEDGLADEDMYDYDEY